MRYRGFTITTNSNILGGFASKEQEGADGAVPGRVLRMCARVCLHMCVHTRSGDLNVRRFFLFRIWAIGLLRVLRLQFLAQSLRSPALAEHNQLQTHIQRPHRGNEEDSPHLSSRPYIWAPLGDRWIDRISTIHSRV